MELGNEFRSRYIKVLQGKEYILYGGLLQLAKARGLKGVDVKVVQIPTSDNGMMAVVEARVHTQDGTFEEVGDASPESVSRGIQPHLLRMAATRAKARAMRDAVGVDMVSLEEMISPTDFDIDSDIDMPIASPLADPGEHVVGFGRYAQKRLREILELDRRYVEWLSENARDAGLRESAKRVLERQTDVGQRDVSRPPGPAH